MEKKDKTFRGLPKYIGFYSLIYGVILLFISAIGLIAVILELTNEYLPNTNEMLLSQLILIISLIISGSSLTITFYGLLNSKSYARLTGILGGFIINLGTIMSSLLVKASFTFEIYAIIITPSVVFILLVVIFWRRLKF